MLKHLSSKIKTALTSSLVILLVVALTAVLPSSDHLYRGSGNYYTYYDSFEPD